MHAQGIATLNWAFGPDSPYAPKVINSTATNQSAAAEYFKGYVSPIVPETNGSWATVAADETVTLLQPTSPFVVNLGVSTVVERQRQHNDSPAKYGQATGGAAIDEWNPSSCPSAFCNNSAAAAAGYTLGKQAWPWSFTAGWVTGQDEVSRLSAPLLPHHCRHHIL